MMSLLFVDTERVWRGGQDQLLSLLRGLEERGHRLDLVCHPGTLLEERAREFDIIVHPVAVRSELGVISFLRFLSILSRVKPDIVAFNTPKPILIGNLASRCSGARARIIFRRVNFPLRKNLFTRLKYTRGIDCIVAISESIGNQLRTGGVPDRLVRTVYEGIDLENFPAPDRPLNRPDRKGKLVVGTVAHLSPEKGHYFLVEAAALIPDVHSRLRFVIVGDGASRPRLESQVLDRGLRDCFQFAGFQNQTRPYLDSFDIFVLPSLSEGLSSAILTAMASSLPVVATDVGGIPELIRHGENGLLVAPADAEALARAIAGLADDPAVALRMGQAGRRRVEEHFTLERKILQTEKLCTELLSSQSSPAESAHA